MKKKMVVFVLGLLLLIAGSAGASEDQSLDASDTENTAVSPDQTGSESSVAPVEEPSSEPAVETAEEETGHGFGHMLLLYIPNRVLDVFDFIRFRLRVGPGLAVGVRATKPLTLSIGGYTSIFAGLPGPRLKPTVKLPFGIENYAGMEVSVLDASAQGGFGPNYSNTEIGVSVHPVIIGLDLTVDPLEVVDLALGFLFIDIRGDDF